MKLKFSNGIYVPESLELMQTLDKGMGVFTKETIQEGKEICDITFSSITPSRIASPRAVQIWEDDFIHSTSQYINDFINHSCNPNSRINFPYYIFEALRLIERGEEITWNYLTSEYDLKQEEVDFDCKCGSRNCLGRIEGFKYLNKNQKMELWPYLSAYLRLKICYPNQDLREVFSL